MSRYKFQVNNTEYVTVDATTLEEALEQAGIKDFGRIGKGETRNVILTTVRTVQP